MSPQDMASNWVCSKCDGRSLERGSVKVSYMGGVYTVELFRCPGCGLVFVTEELAMGKMAEAEQALEDK